MARIFVLLANYGDNIENYEFYYFLLQLRINQCFFGAADLF